MKELKKFREYLSENQNKELNEAQKQVEVEVNFNQPFKVMFHEDDEPFYDENGEEVTFDQFIQKLKSDEKFAYDLFFDNIDFDSFLDRMDENKWEINIK
jgi:hypothetical protein